MTPPRLTQQQLQRRIVPIALLFAASIALSNLAVSYLTVPFMQMLKVWGEFSRYGARRSYAPCRSVSRPTSCSANTNELYLTSLSLLVIVFGIGVDSDLLAVARGPDRG
jgi:hypothetical protein